MKPIGFARSLPTFCSSPDRYVSTLNRSTSSLSWRNSPTSSTHSPDARGVVLRAELPRKPVVVAADVGLIKQAVLNLMLNAVQAMHTASDREKELILRLESDLTEARIHVIDTGPGVPEDMRESIFHPYVSGSPGGSGLGLPTTRRIAEEHGGSVSLEVLQGRGSDFIIHLPRTDAQDEQQA